MMKMVQPFEFVMLLLLAAPVCLPAKRPNAALAQTRAKNIIKTPSTANLRLRVTAASPHLPLPGWNGPQASQGHEEAWQPALRDCEGCGVGLRTTYCGG